MLRRPLLHGDLSESVLRCFYEVYNRLGSGLPEYVYMMALERELRWAGHDVAREVSVPVVYKGEELTRLRIDAVVGDRLVVEAKSTDTVHPTARRQLYNYLKCTRYEVGLLLHFGPEPTFSRILCPNARKPRGAGSGNSTALTDEIVEAEARDTSEAIGRVADPRHPEYPEHPP